MPDQGDSVDGLDEFGARAARVYAAAADHFTAPSLSFWDRFGAETVRRAGLRPGERVLDLCCGAGGSVIPAAQAVGPGGRVLGIDVAAPLLDLARTRADALGLHNVEFLLGDATRTGRPEQSFDAVLCVFGVFFVADMASFVAEMWRLVRPGGRLAVTTWGAGLFEPANTHFWSAIRSVDPALVRTFNPWDTVVTVEALRDLFGEAGIETVEIERVPGDHPMSTPEDFWNIVLGSGYRATFDALTPPQQVSVRRTLVHSLAGARVTSVRTDVLYGLAVRRDRI